MSRPIASTFDVYKPGIGFTITRANIDEYQQACAIGGRPAVGPREIVLAFATPTDQRSPSFQESKVYKRRLGRAMVVMAKPRMPKRRAPVTAK